MPGADPELREGAKSGPGEKWPETRLRLEEEEETLRASSSSSSGGVWRLPSGFGARTPLYVGVLRVVDK